jgi:hypothetical protein
VKLLDVVQYQVVHRQAGLLVRVVARENAPHDLTERVQSVVDVALAQAGARCAVEVEVVPAIEREGGHAAKLKLVVSEVARGA